MPFKKGKRKAVTAAASEIAESSTRQSKRVRVGETSIIGEDGNERASTPASTASGRSMRTTSNANPQYSFTRRGGGSTGTTAARGGGSAGTTATEGAAAPRRAGRPVKRGGAAARGGATREGATRGRGRPRGAATAGRKIEEPQAEDVQDDDEQIETVEEVELEVTAPKSILKKSNVKVAIAQAVEDLEKETKHAGRGRGRPRKVTSEAAAVEVQPEPVEEAIPAVQTTGKFRGRKPNPKSLKHEEVDGLTEDENTFGRSATSPDMDPELQYWLMKAEPDSRIEKGVDVKFSIDDLAARQEPEAWDGVRNPVARNKMRAMRRNDLAFFYHSNCKVPGIVGIMRIVEEHAIDESAFDPDHPYYDVKSTDRNKPRWEMVKVEFVKKFDKMLTLRELRSFAADKGALENMQMLRQSRLSVSEVTPEQWLFILQVLGESPSIGQPARQGGYEGDTDGEGEEPVDGDANGDVEDLDDLNGFRVSASPQTSNGNTIVSLTDIISPTGRKVEIRAEDWDDDDDEDLSGPA